MGQEEAPMIRILTMVLALAAQEKNDPAFAPVTDDPKLPRVLLIGDSISIGYTLPVRKLLQGKANVHRIWENGGPTTTGLEKLDAWLGKDKWDVIHFNWGLHDLKQVKNAPQVGLEDYEKNLRELVKKLKATGATLVWASTTPVPEGDQKPPRKAEDPPRYNAVAKKIMDENGIATDDLYAFALPKLQEIQLISNVHYNPQGYQALGGEVARVIQTALEKK
ncbi:MAG: SGNH/GDSL hydrolase family protein [Planctomycetes bacterium]|nr:SGNH/GDSL hydrolase family protein [Planctomycetota bacterium]